MNRNARRNRFGSWFSWGLGLLLVVAGDSWTTSTRAAEPPTRHKKEPLPSAKAASSRSSTKAKTPTKSTPRPTTDTRGQTGATSSAGTAQVRSKLPVAIQQAIDRAKVQPGRWRHIVIHHSGVNTGTPQGMDRYHREVRHMENGLAYHFVIGNGSGMGDGELAVGHRWTRQLDGGHLASDQQDKVALGICLVGNFDTTRPTARQLQSLQSLVQALMTRCKLTRDAVVTHQHINIVRTRCPGTYFPTNRFLSLLETPADRKRTRRSG
jgi:hypothetical protein